MAKQNVSFIERHVEKVIVAVTGAALLAVTYLFLISSPNQVEVGGTSLGPGAFYNELREKAQSSLNRMQNAGGQVEIPPIPEEITAKLNFPEQIARVFAEPGEPIYENLDEEDVQKIELAQVLPPSRPVLTAGRASAKLPLPRENTMRGGSTALDTNALQDTFWITAVAAIHARKQTQAFAAAGYFDTDLVIEEIDVQRQELMPDGTWSEPVDVQPYLPVRLTHGDGFNLFDEDGNYVENQDTQKKIRDYIDKLKDDREQQNIIRPGFSEYLAPSFAEAWKLPESLPGVDVDLNRYRPRTRTESGGGQGEDSGGRSSVRRDLNEADKAIEEKDFLRAKQLLESVKSNSSATTRQKKKAEDLLDKYKDEISEAESSRRESNTKAEKPDQELLWVNDTRVQPGKIYRYRLRLGMFNQYAGFSIPLRNPADARKLVIEGQWSPWSDPIQAKPDKVLFFTGVRESDQAAGVEAYVWQDGKWTSAKGDFTVGQAIRFDALGIDFESVIVSIEYNRQYMQKRARRDGSFQFQQKSSEVLTVANAQGGVSEHFSAEDRASELRKQIQEEMKNQQEAGRASTR